MTSSQVNTIDRIKIAQTPDARIAIVYSTGGLGDLGFNDIAEKGIVDAIQTLTDAGKTVTVDEACTSQCDLTDITVNIEAFANSATTYDLIIGIGFGATDGINASARAHTNRNFTIIDAVVDLPNVRSITFKEEEGSFLAGAMAAMVSKTNDIAFLGGLDIPLINRFLAGYEHGAREINPDIVVRATYSPDSKNPWGDLEGGKLIAEQFLGLGSDVIFAAAGGTGFGVFDAVKAHNTKGGNKVYAIGVDSDQDVFSIGDILTSMLKRVDIAVKGQVIDATFGNWTSGVENRGILKNGVGISNMTYTQAEKNTIYEGTMTRGDKILDFNKAITNGSIVVRNDITGASINYNLIPDARIGIVYSGFDSTLIDIDEPNDIAKKGVMSAIDSIRKAGKTIIVDEACTSDCTQIEISNAIENFASGPTIYDLIIGMWFTSLDGITFSAKVHPSQKFLIVDEIVDLPNVKSIMFNEQEGSFLAGAMAAMVSKTGDIAFLGGLDIPLINRFLAGFEHGARTINSSIIVRATYSPDLNNPWGDVLGGEAMAKIFLQLGSDVIFSAAGRTGDGVINTVSSYNDINTDKVYAIGVDVDQDDISPGDVLTSMIKQWDLPLRKSIIDIAFSNWTADYHNLGLLENGVGLTDMKNTQTEKNAIYEGTMTRWDKILELTNTITSGVIEVRSGIIGAAINFNLTIPIPPTSSTTTTTTSTTNTTTSSSTTTPTTSSSTAPELPGFTFLVVIATINLGYVIRKKWKLK